MCQFLGPETVIMGERCYIAWAPIGDSGNFLHKLSTLRLPKQYNWTLQMDSRNAAEHFSSFISHSKCVVRAGMTHSSLLYKIADVCNNCHYVDSASEQGTHFTRTNSFVCRHNLQFKSYLKKLFTSRMQPGGVNIQFQQLTFGYKKLGENRNVFITKR